MLNDPRIWGTHLKRLEVVMLANERARISAVIVKWFIHSINHSRHVIDTEYILMTVE